MTLSQVVETYVRNNKYDWILSECKPGKRPVEEMIKYAVYTWTPKMGVAHRSYSDRNNVRDQMVERLRKSIGRLGTPTSFEEIMEWIYSVGIDGFGPVGVFDTALRIGIYNEIYPSMVYLHAGCETGTKYLLGNRYKSMVAYYFMDNPRYPVMDPSVYPPEMKNLKPYHIENFLCQKKDQLKRITDSRYRSTVR